MKELIIKNTSEITAIKAERDGNTFYIKPVVSGADIDTCEAAVIEVPVGNYAFGYHFHDSSEEIFYVLKGVGVLRTSEGEKAVRAGDMLCFPTGEKGAHVLSNASEDETLVFIDFDVRASKTDMVTFPDIGKISINGNHFKAMIDLP